jgi:hypothetical protein
MERTMEKTCTRCFLQKPLEKLPWKNRILGIRHAVCKSCTAQRSSQWYRENKTAHIQNVSRNSQSYRNEARTYVAEYLSAHACVDCGESDPVVLEFDHRGKKRANVAEIVTDGVSINRIQKEIQECEVRCANCHRRRTAKERGWFRGEV